MTATDFDPFFDAVWPRAKATARRFGLSPEEAEDIALEAMAITYDRWARVCGLGHREAWTLRVTANLACVGRGAWRDRIRHRTR